MQILETTGFMQCNNQRPFSNEGKLESGFLIMIPSCTSKLTYLSSGSGVSGLFPVGVTLIVIVVIEQLLQDAGRPGHGL